VNGTVFVDNDECSTPCPGDSTTFCGRAPATAPLSRRQAVAGGPRISIYRQIIIPIGLIYVDVDVLAYVDINTNNINITNINITETNNIDNSINITDNSVDVNVIDNSINIDNSVSNSNNNNNNNIGNKVIIGNNDIIGDDNIGNNNNVYIDLPLVTKTWCQTTTRTGCGCETTHKVPVHTKTVVCYQCGPEVTTIIVTIPTALPTWLPGTAPVAPTVLPVAPKVLPAAKTPKITRTIEAVAPTGVKVGAAAAVFTGGAVANGISGGLALVAGALALL
jgi:hypothetical protein